MKETNVWFVIESFRISGGSLFTKAVFTNSIKTHKCPEKFTQNPKMNIM